MFSGPDHLAAGMAVRVGRVGGAWYYGGIWALGHAAGLTLIGLLYLLVQKSGMIAAFSSFAERMVGVALILMGAWMLLRSHHPWSKNAEWGRLNRNLAGRPGPRIHRESEATMGFGLLHGTAGATHLIGLIPMFALQTPGAVLAYLVAYNGGILVAMSAYCGIVGSLCNRVEDAGSRPSTALRLLTSVGCLLIGSYWLIF